MAIPKYLIPAWLKLDDIERRTDWERFLLQDNRYGHIPEGEERKIRISFDGSKKDTEANLLRIEVINMDRGEKMSYELTYNSKDNRSDLTRVKFEIDASDRDLLEEKGSLNVTIQYIGTTWAQQVIPYGLIEEGTGKLVFKINPEWSNLQLARKKLVFSKIALNNIDIDIMEKCGRNIKSFTDEYGEYGEKFTSTESLKQDL
jgi:hypothetical protein